MAWRTEAFAGSSYLRSGPSSTLKPSLQKVSSRRTTSSSREARALGSGTVTDGVSSEPRVWPDPLKRGRDGPAAGSSSGRREWSLAAFFSMSSIAPFLLSAGFLSARPLQILLSVRHLGELYDRTYDFSPPAK